MVVILDGGIASDSSFFITILCSQYVLHINNYKGSVYHEAKPGFQRACFFL